MRHITILSLILTLLVSCNSDSKTDADTKAPGKLIKKTPQGKEYSKLPSDTLQYLYANVDEIDLIAYSAPLSMNFAKANSVRYILQLMNSKPVVLDNSCKANGHLVLTGQGDVLAEADLYFHNGCNAVAFVKNNKITYVNELSQVGIDFFKRFIPEKQKTYTEEDIEKLKKEYQSQGQPTDKTDKVPAPKTPEKQATK